MPTGERLAIAAFFAAYVAAVTWPGLTLVNRVHPLVLGLPFVMAWIAAWLVAAGLVLWGVDRRARARRHASGDDGAAPAGR